MLWAVRIIVVLVVLLALFLLIGTWLWGVIGHYVEPRTPSDRKDLVNVFVIIGAGVVGFLTAAAALGNLYMSRRNLQQQRDLEDQRAQDDGLQAYYRQMGELLTERALKKATLNDDVALLARAQTLAVLGRLDARRKGALVSFLRDARLIQKDNTIINLGWADLSDADLSNTDLGAVNLGVTRAGGADLRRAFLGSADLGGAFLHGADLREANLRNSELTFAYLAGADLRKTNLESADFTGAVLLGAKVTDEQLSSCKSLKGATMPNGQKYEDWLNDKEGRKEDTGPQ